MHTTGQLQAILRERYGIDVPAHRILYVLRSRGIAASQRAGRYRLFTDQEIARIAAELQNTQSMRRNNSDP
jgi:hypothetical protein